MSVAEYIISQFKQPYGLPGMLAGQIMANRSSNIERNEWTLELLEFKETDHILEIGFGPGIAIQKAAHLVKKGKVVGIDHSVAMFNQASRRNKTAIIEGLVKLYHGDLSTLNTYDAPFDKIYSANVVQFFDNPEYSFMQLKGLLKKGGKIATTYMPRHSGATRVDAKNKADEIREILWNLNFRNIQIMEKQSGDVSTVCVIAQK